MQNPLIPMVAMTGAPQKDEVFAFVKNMKEKCGFTKLMLYPRTGCEVEYLSEEWFALCSYYLESAAANDMKIWLYDEFNWPAGQAGGRVTAHEAYRLKNLLVKNDGKHVQFDVVLTDYPDILNEEAMNLFLSLTHKEYQNASAAISVIPLSECIPTNPLLAMEREKNGCRTTTAYKRITAMPTRQTCFRI